MLSDADYQALLPFRGAEPYCGELDARQQHLAEQKLIESTIVKSKTISGVLQFYETGWIITVAGLDALSAYEKAINEMAHKDAREHEKQSREDAKSVKDKKEQFRHDFKVAAFSVALTLCAEHIGDIVNFIKTVFEKIWSW